MSLYYSILNRSHKLVYITETPKSNEKSVEKLGAVSKYLMNMAFWEPDNTLPGASLCGFSITEYGFEFKCVAKYLSDEKAYAGWREVANLLTNATHWQFETRNTVRSGSLDLQTHDLKKLIGKNWTEHGLGDAPDVKFANPDSPIVIHLYLYYKSVMISIRNPRNTSSDWLCRKYPGLASCKSAGSIASGGSLPIEQGGFDSTLAAGMARFTVVNGTAYTLSVLVAGTSLTISPGGSSTTVLPSGSYPVSATVAAPNVSPLSTVYSFAAGYTYSSNIYIGQ